MGTSAEIYEYNRILDSLLVRLRNSEICEENKVLIEKFSRYLFAQGLSLGRIIKYLTEAIIITRLLGKPLAEANKDDIMDLVQKIERRQDYTEYTKHDYKLTIKKLFKFFKGTEDYPEEVRWIKLTTHGNNRMIPEELLTEDEVKRMVEVARTPRDKALILVLYESGCRIGELLSLKIRNVQFDDYGAVLIVNGKTGMRRVRIIASVPALATWINNHPLRQDSNAPLWISLGTRNRDKLLMYRTASEFIRSIAEKAGIKKRVYPHLFRHSRATYLANHLTEAQMKQYFGWVQASDMASTYVHLSGRDVDSALLKLHGIEINEEEKQEKFNVVICLRCKSKNSPTSKFCNACGLCLDIRTSVQIDETKEKADKLMNELIKNPKILNALLEGIEKLKENESDLLLSDEITSNASNQRIKKIQRRED